MKSNDQPTPDTKQGTLSVSVKFPEPLKDLDLDLTGLVSGDRMTGAFQIDSPEKGTFIFLPPLDRFKGNRKLRSRLKELYNL